MNPRIGILGALAAFFVANAAAADPLDEAMSRARATARLEQVGQQVTAMKDAGGHPVVVFDIDGTVMNSPPLSHDPVAVPGAAAYVKSLVAAGATLVYLTGRKERERATTNTQLAQLGLPRAPLYMNRSSLPTVEYKRHAIGPIERRGTPVAFFDNEKENARMFRAEYPDRHVRVFRPDTTSARPDPGGPGPIYVIKDFALGKAAPHMTPLAAPAPTGPAAVRATTTAAMTATATTAKAAPSTSGAPLRPGLAAVVQPITRR